VTRQAAVVTQSIPVPERRFTHLHVDLVGPLPTSAEGFKYLFTIIDRSTRWWEAIPVKNMEAATIADTGGRRLGQPLWRASDHHLRPQHPVHVGSLGGA
jgi:hypothetical protein